MTLLYTMSVKVMSFSCIYLEKIRDILREMFQAF